MRLKTMDFNLRAFIWQFFFMLIHDPSDEVPSPNHALMHQYKQFLEYLGIVVF